MEKIHPVEECTFSTLILENVLVKEFGERLLNNLHSLAENSCSMAKKNLSVLQLNVKHLLTKNDNKKQV
jgi:hypothetical protein